MSQQDFFSSSPWPVQANQQAYAPVVPGPGFPRQDQQQQPFSSFPPYQSDFNQPPASSFSQMPTPSSIRSFKGGPFGSGGFLDEPPLLEELGINFSHIKTKSITALNPFRKIDDSVMEDSDLAGPLFYCLMLGMFLLLKGKAHFGYIYGVGLLGCISIYLLLNLMSGSGIDGSRATSILGYCLLPMVLLSLASLLFPFSHWLGPLLCCLTIVWCTFAASKTFVSVLKMKEQRFLVAYPIGLFYAGFALLTVF